MVQAKEDKDAGQPGEPLARRLRADHGLDRLTGPQVLGGGFAHGVAQGHENHLKSVVSFHACGGPSRAAAFHSGAPGRPAAEVSRARAGLDLTAFIGLRASAHSRATAQQVEQALTAIPAVVACYVVSGGDDFMVEVAARDLADYERILLDHILAVPDVSQAHTTFAIRTVLSRGPVPLTHWR